VSKKQVDLLIISLTSPLLIGIYEGNTLLEKLESNEKTSEILPSLIEDILQRYEINNLYYARGPGSFMAIKITYLFLKTLSITLEVPLLATDGFTFNQNSPIKAAGSLYFCKENGMITTQKVDISKKKITPFALPVHLDKKFFTKENEPLYILPAV
jgi:tRNA A37 threonylcarbamoyladenosine modification protein TsaB